MDRLDRERRLFRRDSQKVIAEIETELQQTTPRKNQLTAKLESLTQYYEKLMELNLKIKDLMLDEDKTDDELDKEMEDSRASAEKFFAIKCQVEDITNPNMLPPRETDLDFGSQAGDIRGQEKRFRLPKVELMKYDGDLRNWLTWWSQFAKVHEDDSLDAADKFQLLRQSLLPKSPAFNLIKSYPVTAKHYPKAIQDLKDNFGREELLQDVFVRELLEIVFESVKNKNKLPLQDLSIALESHMRTLEELQIHTADPVVILYPLIMSSLPEETLRAWTHSSQSKIDGSKLTPKKSQLDLLREFIKDEVKSEQVTSLALNTFKLSSDAQREPYRKQRPRNEAQEKDDVPTAAGLFTGSKPKLTCLFCDGSHESDRCIKAQSLKTEEKQDIIKSKKACSKCLKVGHWPKSCKAIVKCLLCKGDHYAIACQKSFQPKDDKKSKDITVGTKVQQGVSHQCLSSIQLYTLKVNLEDDDGNMFPVRICNDPGAQRTYGKESLLTKARCRKTGEELLQNIVFGGGASTLHKYTKHIVGLKPLPANNEDQGVYSNKPRYLLEILAKKTLCGEISSVPPGPWIDELKQHGVTLSDVGGHHSEIDILVGMDYWGYLITGKTIMLEGGLHAIETILGWTLGGKFPSQENTLSNSVISLINTSIDFSRMWSRDTIGIRDPIEKKTEAEEELETLQHFSTTVSQDSDGRYIVSLPWNEKKNHLPSNYNIALKRLESSTAKLKSQDKWKLYDNVFKLWEVEGLIKEVQGNPNEGHYLPHRPVFKDSLTTPVRPVFDASCRVKGGVSLNDCVAKGPNLIELIPNILLKFQEKEVGVTADIRKAFQMIAVQEEDQPYQRFLWWESEDCTKVKIFQHNRVVFGASCSPFLLGATINHHLTSHHHPFASSMLNQFYVDNFLLSVNSKEEYIQVREKATAIMAEASMELREWSSSNDTFNDGEEVTTILGLKWNRKLDTISCAISDVSMEEDVTKKSILSTIAKQFDPMGYLAPAILQLKILYQKAWIEDSADWNNPLSETISKTFTSWCSTLSKLKDLCIPRHFQVSGATDTSLHIFCDASQEAFAAAAFLRSEGPEGVKVQLLFCKTRVAPLEKNKKCRKEEKPKIPRLELAGCEVAVRVATVVKTGLGVADISTTFWTDSSVALAWIQRDGDWGIFVFNRVKKILEASERSQWRHISGSLNPADLPSRGCTPQQLLESRWWEGPEWLYKSSNEWPQSVPSFQDNLINMELKKVAINLAPVVDDILPRASTYRRNVAVFARILRWGKLRKYRDSPFTLEELREAEIVLLKHLQQVCFPDVKCQFGNMQTCKDENGLLRIRTKLLHRNDKDAFVLPILLPKFHPIVESLIVDYHKFHGHGGINFIREKLREKYWIANSRVSVKKIIGRCVKCLRFAAKPMDVDPSALPIKRVSDGDPYTTTGVDLAGPLTLENRQKAWIVIYTCAVYRCIHLDLVSSCSSESFLGSLERFIATCGRPNTIYSDNGTNFVGAANFLRQVDMTKLEEEGKLKQIQWTFNPPTAAWWGGWWERLIRSVKDLLKRILGKTTLTFDQMRTCLAGVQSTINDRPLTVVSEDTGDLLPLTPSMFLRPLQVGIFPELDVCSSLSERYRIMKELQRSYQDRFRKEYLAMLVIQHNKRKYTPKVGDIVLVGAENKKRYDWPLGIIVELFQGRDGSERTAKVKTIHGHLIRPLQRLFFMEVSSQEEAAEYKTVVKAPVPVESEPKPRLIKTRRGREVKKPNRYGKWNR